MQVHLYIPVTEKFIHGETNNIHRAWLFSMIFFAHHLLFVQWHKKLSGVKFVHLLGKVVALTSEGRGHPTGLPDQQPVQARI
jgi:hypothetical protein